MEKTIIGIDPGKKGAIAIWPIGARFPGVIKMPETERDLLDALADHAPAIVFLERVGGFIGKGGKGVGVGPAMFNFGMGYGTIIGIVTALKYQLELVLPQKWQKHFSFGTKGVMTDIQWKNKLKQKAQQIFPDVKVINDTADALLIMEYGRKNL